MIAITFDTEEQIFREWKYIGHGEEEPVFDTITRRHRICWTQDGTRFNEAEEFVKNGMEDYMLNRKIHVIPDTQEAWDSLLKL